MTPAGALLADLHARGVAVEAHGDRLRLAPATRMTDADLESVQRLKPELLALLRAPTRDGPTRYGPSLFAARPEPDIGARPRLETEANWGEPLACTVLELVACAPEACAWRLWSHRLGRGLWIARDLAALRVLEREGLGRLPVVLAGDLERLRPLDDATLVGVLDVLATFPGARVVDVTLDTSVTVA